MGQHRSTQRHVPHGRTDEARLVADMIELARQFGRYGYRRIAALLREAGWSVENVILELTNVFVAICIGFGALSVLFVITPFT